jgi:hypothetical protein
VFYSNNRLIGGGWITKVWIKREVTNKINYFHLFKNNLYLSLLLYNLF